MAFSEIELRWIEQEVGGFCKRKCPPQLKDQVSLEYRIKGHAVELFERRPWWDGRPGHVEHSIAKLKFVRTTGEWRIFWMPSDSKWHAYDPTPMPSDLPALVREIDKDPYGCFFG